MKHEVLYVDDEADNRVVFEAAFEDDFVVHTASSGPEALEILGRISIPVVVADQRMPGMSGVELFEILRQRFPHIKRIVLTGYIDSAAMLDAINKGQVFYFLTKPWQRESLLGVLIRAIEAHDLELLNSALTDQLVAAQRLQALGKAAAQVAHEMGNQLSMLPLLEHIEDHHSDDAQLLELSRLARTTHQRLRALVDEIKGFVRAEHHEFSLHCISLAETLHELVAFLRFDGEVPHHALELRVEADPLVRGNKLKLQQVFLNLVKNAAHAAAGRSNPRITVTAARDGDRALVTVEDNGCGIPAEIQERIWQPFFTTKGASGTGLGLDICRQIIKSHQGDVWCESREGTGSAFFVRLPAIG